MTGDPTDLAQRRFDTDGVDSLNARDIVYQSTDVPIIVGTLIEAMRPAAKPGARIIELGFGPADVLEELLKEFRESRLFGLDLSRGYARAAHARFGGAVDLLIGDMERLPLRDASFDAIMTCWTLYFMRDLDAAIAGFRRTLRPGGLFIAATNARDHMHEYTALAHRAVREALARDLAPDIDVRFDIDAGGDAVRRHFPDAELCEWRGTLTLRSVGEVEALWTTYGDWSVTDEETPAVLAVLRQMADEALVRDGSITITRHGGAFVAHA